LIVGFNPAECFCTARFVRLPAQSVRYSTTEKASFPAGFLDRGDGDSRSGIGRGRLLHLRPYTWTWTTVFARGERLSRKPGIQTLILCSGRLLRNAGTPFARWAGLAIAERYRFSEARCCGETRRFARREHFQPSKSDGAGKSRFHGLLKLCRIGPAPSPYFEIIGVVGDAKESRVGKNHRGPKYISLIHSRDRALEAYW